MIKRDDHIGALDHIKREILRELITILAGTEEDLRIYDCQASPHDALALLKRNIAFRLKEIEDA